MGVFAALDVSQEETAICLVGAEGEVLAETKVPTSPDAIADWLAKRAADVERLGMETGPEASRVFWRQYGLGQATISRVSMAAW